MSLYETYLERAIAHHGSLEAVEAQLAKPKTAKALGKVPDDRYLAEMAACVFRSGFVWRVIENKWAGFEEVFNGFLPIWVASRSPEQLEDMASDTRIVRNLTKVRSVYENALLVLDLQRQYGGVGRFLGEWPEDDIVGLWAYLKKHGNRLGGNTGQYFLRFMGKDTFILSRDVCAALMREKIIDRNNPGSRRDLKKVQDCFNALRADSGRPLCQLSRILAMSVG